MLANKYHVLETLGCGAHGRVSKVQRTFDGALFALKQIRLDGTPAEHAAALNEASLMNRLKHKSLVQSVESFIDQGDLCIVMELARGGDLAGALRSRAKPFEEERVWSYLLQIALGVQYLHEQGVLHRDLKPQNILLDESDNAKIGDLGLSRLLCSKSAVANSRVGTPSYFSPEICEGRSYGEKADIWALGCVAYELMTAKRPFVASNQIALALKIVNDRPAPLPDSFSRELRFLVLKMLEKDARQRPGIGQILAFSPMRMRLAEARLQEQALQLKQNLREALEATCIEIRAAQHALEEERQHWYALHQAEVARLKLERDDAMATCDDLRAQVEQLQHDLRVQRQASDELRVAGERCSPPPRELQETELKHAQLEQAPAAPSCGDNASATVDTKLPLTSVSDGDACPGDGKESGPATTAHLRDPPILPVQSGSTAASVRSNMSAQRQPLSMPKRSTSRLKKEPSLGMTAARGQRRTGTADARSSRSTPSVLTKQRGARAFHPPGKNERPASAPAQKLSRHSSQALPSRTVAQLSVAARHG